MKILDKDSLLGAMPINLFDFAIVTKASDFHWDSYDFSQTIIGDSESDSSVYKSFDLHTFDSKSVFGSYSSYSFTQSETSTWHSSSPGFEYWGGHMESINYLAETSMTSNGVYGSIGSMLSMFVMPPAPQSITTHIVETRDNFDWGSFVNTADGTSGQWSSSSHDVWDTVSGQSPFGTFNETTHTTATAEFDHNDMGDIETTHIHNENTSTTDYFAIAYGVGDGLWEVGGFQGNSGKG